MISHMCLQDYANALKLAAGSAQRDIVYQNMGADAAAAGDFKAAGAHYGRIVGGKPPFEELALLLVEAGDPEALQVFLNTKLQVCEFAVVVGCTRVSGAHKLPASGEPKALQIFFSTSACGLHEPAYALHAVSNVDRGLKNRWGP